MNLPEYNRKPPLGCGVGFSRGALCVREDERKREREERKARERDKERKTRGGERKVPDGSRRN